MGKHKTQLLALFVVFGAIAAVGSCSKKTEGPTPTLLRISPAVVCSAQLSTDVTITGKGFSPSPKDSLTDKGKLALPQISIQQTLQLDGSAATAPPVVLNSDVTDAADTRVTWTSMAQMAFTVDQTLALTPGIYDLHMANPTGGKGTLAGALVVVAPPVLNSVQPDEICSAQADTTITLTGAGFLQLNGEVPTVTISAGATSVTATAVTPVQTSCTAIPGRTDTSVCTQITATVGAGTILDDGTYTVSVTNPCSAGCATETTAMLTVVPAPIVYSLDPPAIYNGISIRETFYVSGLDTAPVGVNVIPVGGGTATALTNVVWEQTSPNKVEATVQSGLAAGSYDVVIVTDGCNAVQSGQLTFVDAATIALLSPAVEQPFGLQQTDVPVNIVAKADADLAVGEVNFSPTPRVYFSNASMNEAVPLRAVTFESSAQLSAVVPKLPADTYDVTVINIVQGVAPTVGFLQNAYRSTTVAPPVVSDVSPTLIGTEAAQQVTVTGQNFISPQVTLECRDGATPPATITAGNTDTSLDVVIDGSGLNTGVTCVVRVNNTTDNTWDEWSAISAANPAANIEPFIAGMNMNTARRAPAVAVGSATRKARFLYAIGGDDGTSAGAMISMEAASLGRFGDVNGWRTLQTTLPSGRTLARAKRYGNFMYHMGGMAADGTVTNEILRAEILNPLNVPFIDDVDIRFDPEGGYNGLAAGAWTYVVAPVYAAADANNPGGEGLPSEAFALYTPDVPGGVYVNLSWNTVLGADGATPAVQYRVYRTPLVNQIASEMRLLATVDAVAGGAQTYEDQNSALANAAKAPLLTGALGQWHSSGVTLNTARAAFAFTDASETGCADRWIVYGGMSTGSVTDNNTYEVIDPATMTATQFIATGITARREAGIWVANNQNSTATGLSACEYYMYVGPGVSGTIAAPSDEVNVWWAPVITVATGEVGSFADAISSGSKPARHGYEAFWSGAKVYLMGGIKTNAVTNAVNDFEWTAGEPEFQNENNSVATLTPPRYLFGFARFGAFAYLAGGVNDQGAVTATTEYNVR
ncbi:MAG: hypothetical protein JXR76_24590 [Deltaproteobacteria bacterium]|nr:hypothetical protein [Deltaproteobacteria bacterium]